MARRRLSQPSALQRPGELVTPAEVARVLAKAAAFDQRTVGAADVAAWHEILAPYDLADALEAITRHYRNSTDRVMPAELRKLTNVIRDERHRRELGRSDALALPSRFEDDVTRDIRVRQGLAQCRGVLAVVMKRLDQKRNQEK